MATLEVHDGLGQVRRVVVSRDQTVLFGSSPKCDLVLDDPAVLPFHGRLRWKRDRFKVDASPDAEFIELNGQRMASASFRQGDEIQAGACRIFLINTDEDPPSAPRVPPDDKTRVQPSPFVPAPAAASTAPDSRSRGDATVIRPMPAPMPSSVPLPRQKATPKPAPSPASRTGRGRRPDLEAEEWLEDLEVARPSEEFAAGGAVDGAAAPAADPAGSPRRERAEVRPRPGPRPPRRGWGGLFRALSARDVPPGEERVLSSPLVFGLVVSLAALVVLSIALWGIIQRTVASRLYNQAVDGLNDGDYRNAMRRYDEFLARFPKDERAGRARVLRAMANVRQFTTAAGASWTNALEAEREMARSVAGEPSYRDSSTELAELVLKTAESLADRARASADARALADAESAVALHARVAGKGAGPLLARSRVPARLAEARAAVLKATVRARALGAMDAALRARSSAGVYEARDALVARYADLAEDRGLLERMRGANDLIRRAVAIDTSQRPAETEPRAEPFGPPTSLVLRSSTTPPAAGRNGPLVFALAEGFACGLDGATGAPLWQVPVGLSSPFPPRPIPGGSTVLAFDARSDELVRLDARTGALIWRQPLGTTVADPPLVVGNQVIQPTPGGVLLLIDLASGGLRSSVDLGMPLARTPVSDEAGQFLYVLADRDCLFVLARDPLACVAVEYLGHAPGTVACPPARVGRFLVVAENRTVRDSRWRVFVIDEDGTKLRPVQQVDVPGWTWSTPASSGSVLWSTGDRGGAAAYAIGTYDAPSPFRLIAKANPETRASGPAYAFARSERELWIASGRSTRLDLDDEKGKIDPAWTLGEAGPCLASPQVAGDLFVLTQQFGDGPGVALWGVDPRSGAVRWRTVLGSPWRLPPASPPDREGLTTLAEDGRALTLSPDRLDAGGFVEAQIPGPGAPRLPAAALRPLDPGDPDVLVPGVGADYLLVRSGETTYRRVDLPSAIAATPLSWGGDVLVPGSDGRVDLLDPETGDARAEPYLTPFDRDRPIRWLAPARLDGDAVALADAAGRVLRLVRTAGPAPRLTVAAESALGQGVAAGPISTGGAVLLVTADGRIRALAARDLSPAGAWPLGPRPAAPPAAVAGRAFFADADGDILAFGPDGQRLWSIALRDGAPLGPPVVTQDSACFLTRGGVIERRALADGAPLDRRDLGILPAGDLRAVGPRLVVPVGLGTYRTLKKEP